VGSEKSPYKSMGMTGSKVRSWKVGFKAKPTIKMTTKEWRRIRGEGKGHYQKQCAINGCKRMAGSDSKYCGRPLHQKGS